MSTIVRDEMPADTAAIHALTRAAFRDMPHAAHTEHFIVDALRAAGALALSLVAVEDEMIIGHVAVSPVSVSGGVSGWFGLGPISVAPGRQRQGTGGRLMQAALQRLKERGAAGCVLAGDPAYYSRFGFAQHRDLVFPDLPPEYFLVIALSGRVPHGVVGFHAAFDAKG